MLKFIDMFCGMGTIRMGFEQAGWECVYSVEWDKHKRKIYGTIFGNEPEGRDIRTVRHDDIPYADCWCFGAPCQDFSIAGKREGLDGDRSSLVREVFRLVRETPEECRPKWLLYENVKGMLSSGPKRRGRKESWSGFDFLEILFEMESLGYDIEWQLLNSKDWGVPQNRERVFTLGHLRGRCERKIFPITGSYNEVDLKQVIPGSDAQRVYDSEGLGRTLKAEGGGQGAKTGLYVVQECVAVSRKSNPRWTDTANCLLERDYKGIGNQEMTAVIVRPCLTPDRAEKSQNGRRFKENGEPMFTLTKQHIHGVLISEATKKGYAEAYEGDSINLAVPGSKTRRGRVGVGVGVANTLDTSCNQGTLSQGRIRRLTPRECMRLQGVSDGITDKLIAAGISDTQMYRAAGDATTVNVLYEIAKRLGGRG